MSTNSLDIFRKRMKEARSQKGITLKELAETVGGTEATMQRYESGKGIKTVPYDTIIGIAKALGVSPAYLMGWESSHFSKVPNNNPDNLPSYNIELYGHEEQDLIINYRNLNAKGRDRLLDYSKLLLKDSQLCRVQQPEHLIIRAAHKRTDIEVTDEMRKHDDAIMNDESFWN